MARITVEDGLLKIPNRFKLAIAAAKRAKQILNGSGLMIEDSEHNKAVVNALREIEEGKVRLATAEEVALNSISKKTKDLDALFETPAINGSNGSSDNDSGSHKKAELAEDAE